jgi:hypothetical protein
MTLIICPLPLRDFLLGVFFDLEDANSMFIKVTDIESLI